MKRPSGAKGNELASVVPAFVEMTDRILYGEVWERPGLSKRDRSLLTVAALAAANRHQQLEAHIALALDNGISIAEMDEVMLHLGFYASWPASVTASRILCDIVKKRSGD